MNRLTGKTALITGGNRGIGRAIAHRLAEEGARIFIHFGHDQAAAQETLTDLQRRGRPITALQAPLGQGTAEDVAQQLWQQFDDQAQHLDILVNNAGIVGDRAPLEAVTEESIQRVLAINTIAPLIITKHALTRLRDGGRIINISAHLTRGAAQPDLLTYAMSKGAIDVFTSTLAKHLGSRQITVNAVAPGVVDTEMNADWLGYAREMVANLSPLSRVAAADDIADIVAFLASDDARWVTGQRIDASGGALL